MFSNSNLVDYTKISPNKSERVHDIDTITIHCVVGQVSVERLGDVFAPTKRLASCNYGVGADGRIGMYAEEKDRSWCSSNQDNDDRAITIEVASDTMHPYAVNECAYKSLIALVADICVRNNIKKLIWNNDKENRVKHLNGCNMTVHRDYANKSCPGEFLYSRMQNIADEVNEILSSKESNNMNNNRYNKVEDCPEWSKESIQHLIDIGALKGNEKGDLDLSYDMLRILVIIDRILN